MAASISSLPQPEQRTVETNERAGWSRAPLAVVERNTDNLRIAASAWTAVPLKTSVSIWGEAPEPMTVSQLRAMLLADALSLEVRDEVWRCLVRLARGATTGCGVDWKQVCLALAVPGLARQACELSSGRHGQGLGRDDVEAELILGFLERVGTLDVDDTTQRRVCGRLIDAGVRRARRVLRQAGTEIAHGVDRPDEPALGLHDAGHPEVVLWRAVRAGVLGPEESELIARTRLERHPLAAEAVRQGTGFRTASVQRRRAEADLVAAIREGNI
ncbi:hypothetical protein [Kineosporia sp. NBRC 101677]|uniref:hypothetical protein n=1 Tax=Kineosporia sp. NBRC 101677 TaxID=3032197 RepID=UPI002553C17B|nr:hypothetical protein [Kineosporia sp. NBRC 101677]